MSVETTIMETLPIGKPRTGDKANVRVLVVGDSGTGKSSLIFAAAAKAFPQNVPPVLPPTVLPADFFPDGIPVTIIDSSSSENPSILAEELKIADAVVLTYACDQPATLDGLGTFWMPEFRRLEVKVPVIVVGCKSDAPEDTLVSLQQVVPLMQQFRKIDTCIECSARSLLRISEVFLFAEKAALFPTAPLYDHETQTLKPRCAKALKEMFSVCDLDKDGALRDEELNNFQVKCNDAPLQPSEIVGLKKLVHEKSSEGVNGRGITLTGFLLLHAHIIKSGHVETAWINLRKFGYDNELELSDD